jgi:hypothetical protein
LKIDSYFDESSKNKSQVFFYEKYVVIRTQKISFFFYEEIYKHNQQRKVRQTVVNDRGELLFSLRTKKMPISEYKLCVFGSGGVGKSCLVRQRELN